MFLELPVELACEIVGQWLCLKEVVRLDTSFCHSGKRSILHEVIFQSPSCVLTNGIVYAENEKLAHWVLTYKVRLETVPLTRSNNLAVWQEYLKRFGQNVKHVRLVDCEASSLVTEHCQNVTSFAYFASIPTIALFELLRSYGRLNFLEVESYAEECSNLPKPKATHHVHVKSIDINADPVLEEYVLRMCALESLLIARFTDENHFPSFQFINLRSLSFSTFHARAECLIDIAARCPSVVNLSLLLNRHLSGYEIATVVQSFRPLRTLNLEFTGESDHGALMEVVASHKHSLQELYLMHDEGAIEADDINMVLRECSLLHTISYRTIEGIDYTLMGNLTTLITSCSENCAEYYELQKYCHRVMNMYLMHEYGETEPVAEDISALCDLPALRTLYLVHITTDEQFSKIHSIMALRRPSVRVVREEEELGWYKFFSLPI